MATQIVNQAVHSPVIPAVNSPRPHASVYEIVTQRIIEQLENGVAPWKKPWTSKAPANLCSTKEYSGLNVLMLASQGFPSRCWLTFNQANKLGGHIKRGAKVSLVVYWNIGEEREVTNPDGSIKTQTPFLLRYSTVFNLSQTEGIDIPARLLGEQRENDPIADCEAIVSAMSKRPTLEQSDAAWYRPSTDEVGIPHRNAGILQHALSRIGPLNRPCLSSWPRRLRQACSIRFRVLLQRGADRRMRSRHALWRHWHPNSDARKLRVLPQNVDCPTQERFQADRTGR